MFRSRGLSLLELVTSLVIFGILFFLSLPLTVSIFQRNHLEVVKDQLAVAIHYARSKAMMQGEALILTALPNAGDWSSGMYLLTDNVKHQYNEKSQLIHSWQWEHKEIKVTWQGLQSNNYIVFSPDLNHSASSGHFIIQNQEGQILKLTLNRLGRIREQTVRK
ncbi:MAG: GspH/FimT family pseudopilin [Tatlockia sp.]|nr:GspH/FimT family pseudopilin [Tatlockia sp.]